MGEIWEWEGASMAVASQALLSHQRPHPTGNERGHGWFSVPTMLTVCPRSPPSTSSHFCLSLRCSGLGGGGLACYSPNAMAWHDGDSDAALDPRDGRADGWLGTDWVRGGLDLSGRQTPPTAWHARPTCSPGRRSTIRGCVEPTVQGIHIRGQKPSSPTD
ncbi:hypothetical protein GQ53DRAFT_496653 [Thozetella sp. PMI_491]|nr:hypothetical protein GQ53DRAFT_496653 [Thozetella sp. PMI_491]